MTYILTVENSAAAEFDSPVVPQSETARQCKLALVYIPADRRIITCNTGRESLAFKLFCKYELTR